MFTKVLNIFLIIIEDNVWNCRLEIDVLIQIFTGRI